LLNHHQFEALSVIAAEVNRGLSETYELTAEVLDAAEYGVPQRRRRVFIVGWRGPGEFYFPPATHQVPEAPRRPWKKPARTVGDALKGLPAPDPPSAQAISVARTIPERNAKWYGKE